MNFRARLQLNLTDTPFHYVAADGARAEIVTGLRGFSYECPVGTILPISCANRTKPINLVIRKVEYDPDANPSVIYHLGLDEWENIVTDGEGLALQLSPKWEWEILSHAKTAADQGKPDEQATTL